MSDGWIGGETERLPSCRNYWLVITTVPLLDVVMRTGRAVRPGTVRGALIADGCETARVRARELVAVTGAVTAVPVADCVTVDGNGTRCGMETFAVPVPVRVAALVLVVLVVGVVTRFDVAAVVVPTLRTGGFDAAVGDGVRLDVTVGVKRPVFWFARTVVLVLFVAFAVTPGPAAKAPEVVGIAVLAGVTSVDGVAKIGAAAASGEVAAVFVVVPVAVNGAVIAAVVPVVAAALRPPKTTPPPTSPPPPTPLVMTGVGCELMDELTVDCGLTSRAGGTNCPVTMSLLP